MSPSRKYHFSDQGVFRQNRLCRALARIDRLILTGPSQESLLRMTCFILFEELQVFSVRIALCDPENRSGRCVVYEGQKLKDDTSFRDQRLLEEIIQARETIVWTDAMEIQSGDLQRNDRYGSGIASIAAFPLISGETVHGALIVESDETDYFDPDLISLFIFLSGNIALFLDNMVKEVRRKHHESRATILLKWMEELTRETELPDLFKGALEAICHLTNSDNGEVVLWNPSLRAFSLRAVISRDPVISMEPLLEKTLKMGEGAAGRVIETGTSLLIEDYQSFSWALPEVRTLGMMAEIAVPVKNRQRTVGALVVGTFGQKKLDVQDLPFLEAMGRQLGAVLEHVRLAEHQATLLETIKEIALENEVDGLIERALDSFCRMTGADYGGICLAEKESGHFLWKSLFRAHPEFPDPFEFHNGVSSDSLSGNFSQSGKGILIDDSPGYEALFPERSMLGAKSFMAVPFLESQAVWIASTHPIFRFDPFDLSLLEVLVQEIAIAHRRILSEQARLKSEERLSILIENLPEAIFFKDGEGRWETVNPSGLRLFGLEEQSEWIGKTDSEICSGSSRMAPIIKGCIRSDALAWESGKATKEIEVFSDSDGNMVILDVAKVPLFHPDGSRKGLVISAQDITERKRNEERIEHMAAHDALTDLPNRRVFIERIGQMLHRSGREHERFAVGILDLDGFKVVNDRLGHQKGDELLVQVGKRLGSLLRKTDTLARLGGDEFGLLLTDLGHGKTPSDLFSKIVQALLDPFEVGHGSGEIVWISGSLGLTLCPPDHGDATSLIAHADMALYRAKDLGRNGWAIFESEMAHSLQLQHQILTEFGQALRNGELCLYYQPQVNMETGQVVGVEALVRWNHPERGLLTPESFIGVVEKSELIAAMGRWVLESALIQQKEWERIGIHLRISVNIGARHFLSDGFVEDLAQILLRQERTEQPRIEIEVTETEALRDLERARKTIDLCRGLGVSVSLDDFGTGQASLTSLQQLDIKEVKIDKCFVHRIMASQKDLAIVFSLSVAARMMLIDVVAEGVETEEEGALLILIGCTVAQGFGIARPMLPSMIPDWQKKWKPFSSWKSQTTRNMGWLKDSPLLMLWQALGIFQKGLLDGLDTPGNLNKEWTDDHIAVSEKWMSHTGTVRHRGTDGFDVLKGIHDDLCSFAPEVASARESNNKAEMERLRSELSEIHQALQKLLL